MFKKWANGNNITFPFTQATLDLLKDSNLVNPRVWNPRGLKIPDGFDIKEACMEIAFVRMQVLRGEFPYEFMKKYYPFEWEFPDEIPEPLSNEKLFFSRPDGLANVVHMDKPHDVADSCQEWLLTQGTPVKTNKPNYINFLEKLPSVHENVAQSVDSALSDAFDAKYFFGIQRPEEELFGLTLTHYPEGCPNHPSYPAWHGAAAAWGIKSLIDQFEVDEYELKVLLDTAYVWAMARSLAWVHYWIDNVAWLYVGWLSQYFTEEAKNMYKD